MTGSRWWTAGPAVLGNSRTRARYTAYLYLIGSTTGLLLASDSAFRDNSQWLLLLLVSALGISVAVMVLWVGRRWPRWAAGLTVGISASIIAIGASAAPTDVIALVACSIVNLIAVYAMIFYSWSVAWLYVLATTSIQLIVLWRLDISGLLLAALAVLWFGQAGVVGVLGREASSAAVDSLTGLANRRGWDSHLSEALEWSIRKGEPLSVALIDVDYFKRVNDEQGHAAGDALLRRIAEAWKGLDLVGVQIARRGGDEFAVLMPGSDVAAAHDIAEILRTNAPVPASAGVAQHRAGESASVLLHRTDAALYSAKAAGRGRTVAAEQPDESLAEALAQSLVEGEISVVFQPIFELGNHRINGFEVLARWTHPVLGEVPPSEFIPAAETSGLIGVLDAEVLRQGLAGIPHLQAHWGHSVALSVNASGRELLEPGYADRLLKALSSAGWPPGQLCVEVTESLLDGSSPPALAALAQLREHGIRISIDDFGTGWSSFSRLDALPVDHLKLDRSFITLLPSLPRRRAIVKALLAMCTELGIDVIAEGVETEEQCTLLRDLGCHHAQGYHFSRPEKVETLISESQARRDARSGHS